MKRTSKVWVSVATASMLTFGVAMPVLGNDQAEASVEAAAVQYTDVPQSSSHYANIRRAQELGLMTGYGDGTFKPNQQLSRGNVVKALGKYAVKQSGMSLDQYMKTYSIARVENFSDVPNNAPDQELVKYSKIVKDLGIFTGSDNKLMAGKAITRDQMAEVLVRAFAFQDLPGKPAIKDTGKSAYAKSIEILFENGITVANPYRPHATTSRAQLATFLVRAYDKVSGEESVMPAEFYSKLRQGIVPGAAVQIGSTLPKLKAKLGEPERSDDFEGGLVHRYGQYVYGVPYEDPAEPITTVSYDFGTNTPTKEEVFRHMGIGEEPEPVDGLLYYWYGYGEYEIFFEMEKDGDGMRYLTVKWNG
ncbi:S-layer homology domain-containing protein [Bhargavaea cecembensis]|uniref:S-layer homology domain-containing protein n=1 Tax=Bhargavaea cecembensis TaxID=394098 RepID=UPI00211D50E5|nr:S-layer homology domain-containing protein [Bhargavaea cecembensis]